MTWFEVSNLRQSCYKTYKHIHIYKLIHVYNLYSFMNIITTSKLEQHFFKSSLLFWKDGLSHAVYFNKKVQYRFFIRTGNAKSIQLNYKHTAHPNKMFELNTESESRTAYDTHPPPIPSPLRRRVIYIHSRPSKSVPTRRARNHHKKLARKEVLRSCGWEVLKTRTVRISESFSLMYT
jgi:hypothetical protein